MLLKTGVTTLLALSILHIDTSHADDFDDFSAELPIITSASRLNQSVLSSPSAVTVIDSDMIKASGFIELADILRLVPGFIVAHTTSDTPAVISHGDGWEYPNRMQLLIDGRSTYTSSLSAIDWNTVGVHIEDIDRIEVVRGPAASAYGSNSYAGAINIITKAPELDDRLHVQYRVGNVGEQQVLLRHSGTVDRFNYRLTASKRENNGYEDYFHKGGVGTPQEALFNDFRDNRSLKHLTFKGNYLLDTQNQFTADFSYTTGEAEMLNVSPGDAFMKERNRQIDAWSTNLLWSHSLSDTQEIKVNFFHNYIDEDDMAESYLLSTLFGVDPAMVPFVIGEPDQSLSIGERTSHTHRSDLEVQYSEIKPSGFQYVIGAGLRYDSMSSDTFFPTDGTKTNTGQRLFANMQMPVTDYLSANFGALYEMNNNESAHFSPRASLNFHLNSNQTVRLGYSRAYRIPSLLERHMNSNFYLESGAILDDIFVAAEDIHAEKVTSFDIGYLGKSATLPLSWEFKAYREEYQDTIVFYQDFDTEPSLFDKFVKRIGNEAHSTMYGFEGEITYRPKKDTFIRFHFNHGHMSGTILSKTNDYRDGTPFVRYRDLADRAPDKVYGILAAKQFGSWSVSTGFYHTGKMKWDGRGDTVDSHNRLDASISKTWQLSDKQRVQFRLTGQNITNNKYNEFITDIDLKYEPRYFASLAFIHD